MKNIENNNLFPISLLIDRIISKFNPTNCNNLHIIYSFVFDSQDPIYLEVKDGFCKILDHTPPYINTTIKTTHEIWQKICLNEASLQHALKENLVKCDGEIKNYMLLCNLLNKDLPDNIKNSNAFSITKTTTEENSSENKEFLPTPNTITKIETPSNIITITETQNPEVKINEPVPMNNTIETNINASKNNNGEIHDKKTHKRQKKKNEDKKTKKIIVKKGEKTKKVKSPKPPKVKNKYKNSISINSLLNVMVANFNPNHANDLNLTYKFILENSKPIYLEVKNKSAKLRHRFNEKVDTTITSTYKTWYEIIFKNLKIETALLDGRIKCDGEVKNLEILDELFKNNNENKQLETTNLKFNPTVWFILAIVPWLFYWICIETLNPMITSTFAVLYTTIFITFIKPSKFKKITKLEALTLIVFPFYNLFNALNPVVFNEIVSSFFLNIILILMFFMSSGCEISTMSEYSEISYNSTISETVLFKIVNKNLTILWSVIFTIRFVLSLVLETPLYFISYALIILGAIISWVYLKLKLNIKD